MKKFRNVAVALVLMLCATAVIVACGKTGVAGNSYKFKEAKFEWAVGTTEAEKLVTGITEESYKEMYKDQILEFKKDGSAVFAGGASFAARTVYYKQDGDTIKLYADVQMTQEYTQLGTIKVDGDLIVVRSATLKLTTIYTYEKV